MRSKQLPKTYRGYLTADLLEIHEALSVSPMQERHRQILRNASPTKTRASQRLILDFQLTPAAEHIAEQQKILEGETSIHASKFDTELAELIRRASMQFPTLAEKIKDCQQYCSGVAASVAEISVKGE